MHRPLFTTAKLHRRNRWLSPALVFLLLWGAMAFALHSHNDEIAAGDSECQLCLFASISSSAVAQPPAIITPVISLVSIAKPFIEAVFTALQTLPQQARAPPVIS